MSFSKSCFNMISSSRYRPSNLNDNFLDDVESNQDVIETFNSQELQISHTTQRLHNWTTPKVGRKDNLRNK